MQLQSRRSSRVSRTQPVPREKTKSRSTSAASLVSMKSQKSAASSRGRRLLERQRAAASCESESSADEEEVSEYESNNNVVADGTSKAKAEVKYQDGDTKMDTECPSEEDKSDFHPSLPQLNCIKTLVLGRLSERNPPSNFINLASQSSKLTDLVNQSIRLGESNSCLLVGHRGVGKTALLNRILETARKEYTTSETPIPFYTVRLSGLIHTDDRLALREIVRQLNMGRETSNMAFSSFATSLAALLSLLKSGSKAERTIPIVIILDEFDLFAQHLKQTLLYNLFDVCQSNQAPLCVLGLTCRVDALDLLEKRVKSRFSHRQIWFSPLLEDNYVNGCKAALLLAEEDVAEKDPIKEGWSEIVEAWNQNINVH